MGRARRAHLWAALLALGAMLKAAPTKAQQFGDGHHGPLQVDSHITVNQSALITADSAPGSLLLTVSDTTAFLPGNAILVVQMQWVEGGARGEVGTFELHRLSRVRPESLELETPTAHHYPRGVSQVVTVPEYSRVDVTPDAGLLAPRWHGAGGILAFLVDGPLNNAGVLDARGAGFRGGTGHDAVDSKDGCTRLDEPAPGGSERGEGARFGGFGPAFTGRDHNDTGGGGGVCLFSGGGGGAHQGEGGGGGLGTSLAMNGGLGGVALPGSGLLLGGGGGAANGLNANGKNGGNGGGIIFIAARELTGSGLIVSDGSPGQSVTEAQGAGSGGGAGGTIWLDVATEAICQLSAGGGHGGHTLSTGPGGGGGGGRIRLAAQVVTLCPASASAGAPGLANQQGRGAGPLSPQAPPFIGAIEVTDVYTEPVPIPQGKKFELMAVGCGCGTSGQWSSLLLCLTLLSRRRR